VNLYDISNSRYRPNSSSSSILALQPCVWVMNLHRKFFSSAFVFHPRTPMILRSFSTLSNQLRLGLPDLLVPLGLDISVPLWRRLVCSGYVSWPPELPSLVDLARKMFKLVSSQYSWTWKSLVTPIRCVPVLRICNNTLYGGLVRIYYDVTAESRKSGARARRPLVSNG
jgi:hypothetical protein